MDTIRGTGTIRYMDFEGGFYGIVSDDGENYYPGTLDEALQKDSLRVRFELRELKDVMTFVMWGRVVDVVNIEPL